MDITDNIEFLDESSSALPELSFDDLLDPSPAKKSNKPNFDDDDALEVANKEKNHADDTLNTPGPKKPPIIQKNINTSIAVLSGSKMSTTIRKQAVKLGNSPNTLTNVIKNNNSPSATPVLLNNQNILPKSSAQTLNNSIKFTQKVVGANGSTTNLSLAGKTAVRTSNGQIIYIQKSPASSNIKTATATTVVKSQALGNTNSKPVTIQVLRAADGSYHPLKTSTTGTNGKSTLTLSPTSLAGKKIITSSGGQVIIKGTIKSTDSIVTASSAKTITTNAITGVRTVVKPLTSSALVTSQSSDLNKSKPIVVHGTSGKQIIVSNQNIVKLVPKPQTISTTAAGSTVTTSTTGSSQVHAIQIPGKIGVQYVRVLPNTKVPAKTVNSSLASSVTSTITSVSTKTLNTINQPVKIMNPLPQKFTVVQKGTATKLMVTQKKDVPSNQNKSEFSPMTSKVQKTIVTVPSMKSLGDEKIKNLQTQVEHQSQIKSIQNSSLSSSSGSSDTNQSSLARKHKITEINSEIQRITTKTTTTSSDYSGPPEIKKPTPNNRVVVVSNNLQPKILNNSIQQPGRIVSTSISPATQTSNSGKNVVQTVNVTQNGNKLYTVLKPSSVEQKTNPKLYSVLKTNNPNAETSTATTTTTTLENGIVKHLINKQVLQQQQKLLQLKQQNQQQNITSQNIKVLNTQTTTSSTYLLPIKIKEEPADSIYSDTTTINVNAETTAALLNLPPTSVEEDVDTLDNLVGGVRRKHCNCSKSQCLKLYCDCFANGEFCQDCTCKDCFNNLENEDERQRAIKACLDRNPNAFKPKITSSRDQADMRLHNKGCNCKRSGCLKNYCECYEAKIPCSSNCKCVGCRNVEDRPDLDMDPIDPKIMATIAMGGTTDNLTLKRTYDKSQRDYGGSVQSMTIKTEKFAKEPIKTFSSYDTMSGAISPTIERQQCNFITQEVIDATIQCMITQADECEKNSLPAYQTEKMVMEELGRCLVEIIDFSIRNTDNSYSQE